jgi:glycerophosphoryl diester phosphodiesterase
MRLVSHRGAGGLAQENSLKAVKIGDTYGPEFIEVDVHRTKDGVFVLHHGDIKRTYLGTPLDETYKELKTKIPTLLTLEEFLKHDFNSSILFDIKIRNSSDELIKIFKKFQTDSLAFTSPHVSAMKALNEAFPEAKVYISQPFHEGPYKPIQLARKYSFTGVSLNKWWLGPYPYFACKRSNLEYLNYTVDRSITMRVIAKLFPHIILTTNRPDRYPKHLLKK